MSVYFNLCCWSLTGDVTAFNSVIRDGIVTKMLLHLMIIMIILQQ